MSFPRRRESSAGTNHRVTEGTELNKQPSWRGSFIRNESNSSYPQIERMQADRFLRSLLALLLCHSRVCGNPVLKPCVSIQAVKLDRRLYGDEMYHLLTFCPQIFEDNFKMCGLNQPINLPITISRRDNHGQSFTVSKDSA